MLIGVLVVALLAWLVLSGRAVLRGPSDVWLRISLAMAGACWSGAAVVDVLTAAAGSTGRGCRRTGRLALLLVAVWLMAARTTVSVRAMAYTGLAVLALLTVPTARVRAGWRACTGGKLEKCSVAGGGSKLLQLRELRGDARVVHPGRRVLRDAPRELVVTTSFCLLVIVATGSRTSYLAVGR